MYITYEAYKREVGKYQQAIRVIASVIFTKCTRVIHRGGGF